MFVRKNRKVMHKKIFVSHKLEFGKPRDVGEHIAQLAMFFIVDFAYHPFRVKILDLVLAFFLSLFKDLALFLF